MGYKETGHTVNGVLRTRKKAKMVRGRMIVPSECIGNTKTVVVLPPGFLGLSAGIPVNSAETKRNDELSIILG